MSIEQNRWHEQADWHAALADVNRLRIVESLALGDRSPSELQAVTGLPSNLVAHHLAVLTDAGIVTRRRSDGDRRRTYLTLVDPRAAPDSGDRLDVARIVVVCTANSARSQIAAAALRSAGAASTVSAGTHPADQIATGALDVAARHGLVLDDRPRSVDEVRRDDDYVIAVCDQAYEELSGEVALHWSIPDPVATGTAEAFDDAFREITARVDGLVPVLR